MRQVRQSIGGLGNIMFKQARLIAEVLDREIDDVYVQHTKYWGVHVPAIHAYFRDGIGEPRKEVAVHIRRGDYLRADNFHVDLWKTDYYQKAVKFFPKGTTYMVFCKDRQSEEQDALDREWCEQNLTPLLGDWKFAPDGTEVDDLNNMAACSSLIMANSSFSWWAAFIGKHEKVICPSQWFVDGNQRTELLDNWIKI